MNKHFRYLVEDDEGDFFQKAACEVADTAIATAAEPLEKTASARHDHVSFEKVAARLDQDLFIIKTAGECGENLGMTKRAYAYLDRVVDECPMETDQLETLFDKVASLAIQTDIEEACQQLCSEFPEDAHPYIRSEFAKVGHEIAEYATMDKEAFVGALLRGGAKLLGRGGARSALGRAAQGAAGVAGRGAHVAGQGAQLAGRAAKGVSGAVRGAAGMAAKPFRSVGQAVSKGARALKSKARVLRTQVGQSYRKGKSQAAAKQQSRLTAASQKGKLPGQAGAAGRAEAAEIQRQARSAGAKQTAKIDKGWDAPGAPKGTTAPRPQAAGTPAAAQKTRQAKVESDTATGAAKAKKATKPAGRAEAAVAGASTPKDVADTAKKGPGLKDAYKSFQEKGWKGLSQAEKQKLIQTGVMTAGGYRAATGKGLVTGGEGLI